MLTGLFGVYGAEVMKKIFLRTIGAVALILLIVAIYFNTNYYIKNQRWKYKDGKHIGDWVTLDRSHNKITKVVFCYGKSIIIEDVKTGEKGYYENK